MANSAPWEDHRSSDCSGHCAFGRLCSDVVRSAKFHLGHRPTVPRARRPARPDYYRRVRIPLAVPSGESGEILTLDWTRSKWTVIRRLLFGLSLILLGSAMLLISANHSQ